VGLLGTNVRPDQVEQLRAFSRAYLVLDTDDAGVEGTLHLQEAIGATAVAVVLPEDVKDPAELALRPGGHLSRASTLAAGAMSTSVHAPRRSGAGEMSTSVHAPATFGARSCSGTASPLGYRRRSWPSGRD